MAHHTANTTLTVIGDSIAAGLGDPDPGEAPAPWAPQVARALGIPVPSPRYRNLGVPGLRVPEIRAGQLAAALDPVATITVVTGGGNDLFARGGFDPAAVEQELDALVGPLAAAGSLVVTFGRSTWRAPNWCRRPGGRRCGPPWWR